MAMLPPPFATNIVDPFQVELDVTDISIGGKLLSAKLEVNTMDEMSFRDNDEYRRAIKQKIASELARAMIESNLIEFTQISSAVNLGCKTIHARCYLAPDNQVKILRIHHAKK